MAEFISLSLFGLCVNNDQNTHGLLSSFPLSLSPPVSLTFCIGFHAPDDNSEISFFIVYPLTQTNALISLDLEVRLYKMLFIKHIDSRAAIIKNTWSNWQIHIYVSNEILLSAKVNPVILCRFKPNYPPGM